MFKAYFSKDYGETKSSSVFKYDTFESAYDSMMKKVTDTGFKSYYQISTSKDDNTTIVDYGSHSNFIIIEKEQEENE